MSIFSNRGFVTFIIGLIAFGTFATTSTAFAASDTNKGETGPRAMMGGDQSMRPAVIGTVSAISGTTLTVTSKMPMKDSEKPETATETTYTVNAANATITKNNAASTFSAIAIGDTVMIEGTVSGTTVTATAIRDGVAKMMGKGPEDKSNGQEKQQPKAIVQGNGQPVVGGTITAISGATLTIKNTSDITYTVDATNAVIMKDNATSTLSAATIGDTVIVQGSVNGTSIIASTVIDQGTPKTVNSASTTPEHRGGGFFSAIGGFFSRLFGFF
jgi:hypothetical protein